MESKTTVKKQLEELLKKTTRAQIRKAILEEKNLEKVKITSLGKNTQTFPTQNEFFVYDLKDIQEKTLSFSEPILDYFKGNTHFKYFKPKPGWKFGKHILVGKENSFQHNYTLQIITQGYLAITTANKRAGQKEVLLESYKAGIYEEPFSNNKLGIQEFLECYVKRPSDNRIRWSYFPVKAEDTPALKELLQ